jgi:Putative peptidoglycan binding domain
MNSPFMKRTVLVLALGLGAITTQASDCAFFRGTDPLAQRDEWGLLHQGRSVNSTDFAPRYRWRFDYYFKAPEQLILQPGYVGAMQTALRRLGYYCGPIDGVFSPEVGSAIARLQKNYSMRVTGTFTDSVRWALHLP